MKRHDVLNHIKKLANKAIFLLKETHTEKSDEDSYRHIWGTKDFLLNHGATNSRGTAILFSNLRISKFSIFLTM